MKDYIKYMAKNNIDEITKKSFLNCHIKGLHSIMFDDTSERTIRLYISEKGNNLHYNSLENYTSKGLSIAFHPHHCNLTLHCVKGSITNWTVKESDKGFPVMKYHYQSKISNNEMKFIPLENTYLKTTSNKTIYAGNKINIDANVIHTIGCKKNTINAWFVYEGQENLNYQPFCWSNTNLNQIQSSHLYKKPSKNKIIDLLKECDLLD